VEEVARVIRLPNTPYHPNSLITHGFRALTTGVVIHTIEGTGDGAEMWFKQRAARGLGAHAIIGQTHVVQLCDLQAVCYHAPGANHRMIGFEHEGFARYSKTQWLRKGNRSLLRASANRTAWVCWHYKLGAPRRGKNVFGHVDFPAGGHHDPGPGWPWVFYMLLCRNAYKRLVRTGKW
jgi:hypothetical protein